MDCGANWKLKLYPCNRWDCNTCFGKRVYWLREQALSFVFQLPVNEVYFTVLKHFKNPRDCHDMVRFIIDREKSLKSPHRSKFEYFYVIANHGFSGWHIHLISNQKFEHQAQYSESVKQKKPTALYMIKNLIMSQMADYEGVRRYGSSRLLYKQNKKTNFKSRLKLNWLIVQMALVQAMFQALICMVLYPSLIAVRCSLWADISCDVAIPSRRNNGGITEELVFRLARDDLIGESALKNKSSKVGIKRSENGKPKKWSMDVSENRRTVGKKRENIRGVMGRKKGGKCSQQNASTRAIEASRNKGCVFWREGWKRALDRHKNSGRYRRFLQRS